MTSLIIRVN